ncbi:hypothetical protein WR25_08691 isoform G [Diploscapter pachys]|uniref:C-type lectin domain-containing protein n=1 Tax=Diploscapter pachys TaxID=2018661 RepID=A0A2A2L262_9BILA|nr:hypothetical protein WR25_08691 isoform C [Diploscapter pachys]PAV80168.1 hypothetical protein WR25_08691 isoform D [Diploscapter pachys]PAV80171.1 hypothetical protein WR25_08691 isoform G [Diploscapter pachys]
MIWNILTFISFGFNIQTILSQSCYGLSDLQINNVCYHFVDQNMDYTNALANCTSIGYSLASIHDLNTNTWIQKHAASTIELRDAQYLWIGLYNPNNTWQWTDGSPYNWSNIANGEPFSDRRYFSMHVADGQWFTRPGSWETPFVCSGPPYGQGSSPTSNGYQISTTDSPSNHCPRNWGFFNGTNDCYFLKSYYNVNNTEYANCNGSIRSQAEQDFVSAFAQGFFASTGCFDQIDMTYIIGTIINNGSYVWQGGEPVDFDLGWLANWNNPSNLVVVSKFEYENNLRQNDDFRLCTIIKD